MNNKKFKVAFVGCGAVSPNHFFALSLLDNVEIVALCDKVYANAENLEIGVLTIKLVEE